MNRKLIVFDVDGVLLDNKLGGLKDVLVILGKEKEVREIDEEYQRRKFSGPWGLAELADLYKDFSEEKLKEIATKYCQANLMNGAKEVVEEIRNKGCLVGALSSNPQFIMEALKKILSLNFSQGTELEFKNGIATGRISKKVDRYGKAEILKEKIEELNLGKEEVVVIGDSLTDLAMAKKAGKFIAFNAKEEVKNQADVIIKEKDLRKIICYL